ncbi:MAG: ATP-binding protein [Bryobacteraceae bacterium]
MPEPVAGANPYVGPKPFEIGQPLFGRDREVAELRYLLTSDRIVVLYSPSGAGKSSLVQAGLIPKVETRFEIWGPTRVNKAPPPGVENRYVWSTIAGLEKSSSFQQVSLAEYVSGRSRDRNPLLIFDQFEEILRVDPVDLAVKRAFFEQLGEVLRDPQLWALFILREDFLAQLDPYARLIPTHLQNRYRIDRLTREAAVESIVKPTANTPRKYAEGVVDTLVDNLAKVKVQQLDGTFREEIGAHVEPLQLQVVCFDLWDRMSPDDLAINPGDVGDIDTALRSYYEKSIQKVAVGNRETERAIRDWFQDKLITADGVRNQVLQESGHSGGLDNNLVQGLVDTYLVRAEPRGGTTWFELAHDRLVKPLQDCNREWLAAHLSSLQKTAALWRAQGRPAGLLLEGDQLEEARQWALANPASLKPVEREILAASEHRVEEIRRDEEQNQKIRRAGIWAAGLAVVAIVACIFSVYLWREAKIAQARAERAEQEGREFAQRAFDSKAVAITTLTETVSPTQGPRVVYLQIRRNSPQQSAAANQMKVVLEKTGQFQVPGIEALLVGPKFLEVRYFRKTDAGIAHTLADLIKAPDPIYIDRYESSDTHKVPNHFEIWFGPALGAEEQTSLDNLLRNINVPDAGDRKAAVAQLVDQYRSSPEAISAVLKLLDDSGMKKMSAPGLINALYFLKRTESNAWTPEQRKAAVQVIAAARQRFPTGPQVQQQIDEFEKSLGNQQSP